MKTNSTRKTLLLSVLAAIFAMSLTVMAVMGFANTSAFKAHAEATVGISNVNVTLNEDIVVKFHTDATTNDGTKVVVLFNGKTTEITENLDGVFSFAGVTPQNFNDEMTVTMYAADGTTQIGEVKTLSVQSYLEDLLKLSYENSGCASQLQYTAMKELAVDLLNYGAAAQTYVSEDAENLANKNLTAEQQALATETITNVESDKAVSGDMWVGASVRFDYKLGLLFVFKADSLDGITAKVDGREVTPKEYSVEGETEKCWVIRYNAFNAVNMNDAVTATLSVEGQEDQTFTYSIASYVAAKGKPADTATDEEKNLAALVNATYAYGFAAVAYSAQYEMVETPTFEETGLITMDGRGYNFNGTKYGGNVELPVLNFTDYTVETIKTVAEDKTNAEPTVTTTFTYQTDLINVSFTFETDDCLEVNDVLYSRYELPLLNSDDVEVTYDEATGYTYNAKTEQTLNKITAYGTAANIVGDVIIDRLLGSSDWHHYNAFNVGTAEQTANVTVKNMNNIVRAMRLNNGADIYVAKGSTLTITNKKTGAKYYAIRSYEEGSTITVDGTLTCSASIRIEGAATDDATAEYGFLPNFYVRKGTVSIENGQLMSNAVQVGSVKDDYVGILNISQNFKGSEKAADGTNAVENTINFVDRNANLRYVFANGEVDLSNNYTGTKPLTAIDVRTGGSSYTLFDEKITVTTGGTQVYGNLSGSWGTGSDYKLMFHAGAKFNYAGANIYHHDRSYNLRVTYFDTATIKLDGKEQTVYVATGYKYSIKKAFEVLTTDLTVDNGDGTKSLPAITPAAGEYTTQSGTLACGIWTFNQAKNANGDIIYYKAI